MTRNEAIKWLTEFIDIIDQSNGAVDLEELTARGLMDPKLALTEISELFNSLDEKHGKWIVEEYGWGRVYHCSNCDFETSSIRSRLFSWNYPTHCPRCGTNMKNIQEARHIAWLRDNLEELIETGKLTDYEQKFKIFTYILERKKTHNCIWVKKESREGETIYECSNCEYTIYNLYEEYGTTKLPDFCIHCGSDMTPTIVATKDALTIRLEKKEEQREVENLIRESFWNVYRPGCYEHYVMHTLRDDPAFVKQLNFVMEKDGKLIGQNMFMRTIIKADNGSEIPVLTMGPICITPELKRQGYGKKLLDYSLEKAKELGFGAVLFEGNIDFYGKSGFDYGRNFGIRYHDLPEDADDSFFLCKELRVGYLDGVLGVYQTPQGYYVSEEDVNEFDKEFPPKEKQKLPGQIF